MGFDCHHGAELLSNYSAGVPGQQFPTDSQSLVWTLIETQCICIASDGFPLGTCLESKNLKLYPLVFSPSRWMFGHWALSCWSSSWSSLIQSYSTDEVYQVFWFCFYSIGNSNLSRLVPEKCFGNTLQKSIPAVPEFPK